MQTIHIKNMVCPRCIEAVKQTLNGLQIPFEQVMLGEAQLRNSLEEPLITRLKDQLTAIGFELLEDKKARIVEKVKNLIIEMLDQGEAGKRLKLSDYLSGRMGYDYSHISGTFAEQQGITIERFLILQKIERVKELLTYQEMNLNEIADALHYSSAAALSNQFKEVTGMTPSEFKKLQAPGRIGLDEVGRPDESGYGLPCTDQRLSVNLFKEIAMARIAGITTQKDSKGKISKVTFDLKKHGDAVMPLLIKLGAIEEDEFEKEWKQGESTKESLENIKEEMRTWDWKA